MNTEHAAKLISFDAGFSFEKIDLSTHRNPGVYCLYCTKTHMAYIGGTGDCKERIAKHFRRLRFGDHPCAKMLEQFREHGEESFFAFVVEYCEEQKVTSLELEWINRFGEARVYNKKGLIQMEQDATIDQLCRTLGVKPDTMRVVWKRQGLSDFNRKRTYTREEYAVILAYYSDKKAGKYTPTKPAVRASVVREQPTIKKSEQGAIPLSYVRDNALSALLIFIVTGHAALIWYDCAVQWSVPGIIGGGLAFFIVVAALLLATDKTRVRTSEIALYFVALVDIGAWWVHMPTFQTYRVDDLITGVFAAFLCACSWVSLYLYRDSKID